MNKAQIITAVRSLVNEASTTAGALLSDTGNLLGFIEDAVEQVVLDLVDTYPNELLTYKDVSMLAGVKTYDLSAAPAVEFWQILKIAKTVAGENETEMDIIDPLSHQYAETHDETNAKPYGANIINGTLYVYPTPSTAIADYIRVWGIRPEATTLPNDGPAYLPRVTHRLIVFWAAGLVATMIGVKPDKFILLYSNRLEKIKAMQKGKFQQAPRFVRESVVERTTRDTRERTMVDLDWP
jgi:hypothetical protein